MDEQLSVSRRQVLKGAGAAALTGAAGLVTTGKAFAARAEAPRWAFIVDLRRCIGCRACTVACKAEFNVPLGAFRAAVYGEVTGVYPDSEMHFLPRLCNHCEGNKEDKVPPCVKECPEYPKDRREFVASDGKKIRYRGGATYKRPDGLILFDNKLCTGCGKCIEACPYGARNFNKLLISGKDSTKNGITKCNFCEHRIDNGVDPACVNICPGRARFFGDLNDPASKVSKLNKEFGLVDKRQETTLLPVENTVPMCFYIDDHGVLSKMAAAKQKFEKNDAISDRII
ncbi:MAG: 4Fe-4S dicluster domain-containing protein [Deltaproteobacteria bacterium]|nr:4Fe-4S dicluster domain-containing protein [Deltaproteobacteria bacterium]MBW1748320.1 4Fe-4S dicluster domain-containing protein [Deltaproteobacteria bacterium]MBW2157368.1 4Fe-4S dicluster domain-containing protein [Deltaproteobacteria bacterium]MBW2196762.1 4Fe-4S dicluster domain-containing protein [Deltaproteobacteria bacterium]MBW2326345.1 4Fe-4S dicluster domain-containing protein [Deltaproteobacteria bacterium]